MSKLVVKISGKVLETPQLLTLLLKDIASLESYQVALVHGGGKFISEYCQQQNIQPQFDEQGLRITSEEEMKITDMMLAGVLHSRILRHCVSLKIQAVGLTGADCELAIGETVNSHSHTGHVTTCNVKILDILVQNNILPIINSVSSTPQGRAVNINADEIAVAIAKQWQCSNLIFISDIPGVINNGTTYSVLTPSEITELQAKKIIHSGMIPKTNNAVDAINQGVDSITIGNYTQSGDLLQLIQNNLGTKIIHERKN